MCRYTARALVAEYQLRQNCGTVRAKGTVGVIYDLLLSCSFAHGLCAIFQQSPPFSMPSVLFSDCCSEVMM